MEIEVVSKLRLSTGTVYFVEANVIIRYKDSEESGLGYSRGISFFHNESNEEILRLAKEALINAINDASKKRADSRRIDHGRKK